MNDNISKPRGVSITTNLNKKNFSNLLGGLSSLLGLIILSIILAFLSPYFLTVDNMMNIARQSSINALISIGELLAILTAGIELSVGSIMALSICVMGIAVVKMGINPFIGIFICLGVGLLLGFVNGVVLTKLHLPHPFISTLGMQNIARGLALVVTAASPISGFPKSVQFLGAEFLGPVPVSIILVLVVYIIFHIFLTRTPTGRHIYAIGGNKEAARLSGVNVDNVLIVVYSLAGFMAALAGLVLAGRVNAAFPLAGVGYETDAIAAVIIGGASFMGGVGTVWGTLIGALLMAVLRNGLNLLGVSADWQTFAIGAVIIGAVFIDVLRRRAQKNQK